MRRTKLSSALVLAGALAAAISPCLPARVAVAQSVSPVITEYKGKAEGKFSVTNNTMEAMMVVLEPKSFSIDSNGRGSFRTLDPSIHVELSAMSVRLQPQQTYWVFYKATSDKNPAWFSIYSTFSPMRHGAQINVQIQLPHTVYLYQEKPLQKVNVEASNANYSGETHKLLCELKNVGPALGRVQEVKTVGGHGASVSLAGFPLLPGMTRDIEVDWKGDEPPKEMTVVFEHFTLKPQIIVNGDTPPPSTGAKDPSLVER